ncbi:MAG: bifunctional diaminohydroxyphosphoribosylaminopyrimidine deaminase/5-amino-6-(5-phosphoribosylamino)uracil reductase RibD [Opitutales bacterium]|nr:bifunctional diaminohydroxyphosphoribosylaminopyrimidine deaminase/5-amino-6-(5-phosphoribosylamino)uracil reductase RibD [Opitutales bacterium]
MTLSSSSLSSWYNRVLELARKGWGDTHPNPMVGALLVEDGEIVAEGFHCATGKAHAEVEALNALGRAPHPGASLVISLEPCSTHGKTPPCTEAILKSGIQSVYVACEDPNPQHAGQGLDILREHGLHVQVGDPDVRAQATRLNFIFNHNMQTGRPLIALKLAESANGKLANEAGTPSRVTESDARADMMQWRRLFPSICVGSGTVLSDDPSLTARLPDDTWCPLRLVVDSTLSTLAAGVSDRALYTDKYAGKTRIITTDHGLAQKDRVARARELGITILQAESCPRGRVSPLCFPEVLTHLGVNSVYCEGGARMAESLYEEGLADYLFRYRSPREFLGPHALPSPIPKKLRLRDPLEVQLGPDHLTHGFL